MANPFEQFDQSSGDPDMMHFMATGLLTPNMAPKRPSKKAKAAANPFAQFDEEKRHLGERLGENLVDGINRSGLGAMARQIDSDADGFELFDDAIHIREGGKADQILDNVFGPKDRGPTGMTLAAIQERERQLTAQERGQADPWHEAPGGLQGKVAAGLATLGGQVLGAMGSPENWVAPGAKTVAGRIAGNAGVAGGTDALLQGGELTSGIRDNYDPVQTAGAVAIGGAIAGGIEATPFVKQLLESNQGSLDLPENPLQSNIAPMSQDHVPQVQADAIQYQQMLKVGSPEEIKAFFAEREGPQPTTRQINAWVKHRDSVSEPNVKRQPKFDYEAEYTKRAQQEYSVQNRTAVQEHIHGQMTNWKNAPEVEVVGRPDEIEDVVIRNQALQDDPNGDALGFLGSDGKIRIFSDRIPDAEVANTVLFHEALGHYGLAQQFGARLDQTIKSLLARNVSQFARDVAKWQKQNPKAYGGDRIRAAEEVLAEASQKGVIKKAWQDALTAAVRQFGRKMGMKLAYSDTEVRHILAMSHDAVINGKPSAAANGFRGATPDPQSKFMFIGRKAKDFEQDHPTAFTAKDGIRRNEIDDSEAYLKIPENKTANDKILLDDILEHPELFKQYPHLRKVRIKFENLTDEGVAAYYQPGIFHGTIGIDARHADTSVVLHEVQHAIQDWEQHPDYQKLLRKGGSAKQSEDEYWNHPSELEAFATEDRHAMNLDERIDEPQNKFMRAPKDGPSRRDFLAGAAVAPITTKAKSTPIHTDVATKLRNMEQMTSINAAEIAADIAKTSKNPAYRLLAMKLSRLLGDAKLQTLSSAGEELNVAGITRTSNEFGYRPGDITLYYNILDKKNTGLDEETALHEMLHSVVVQRYGTISTYLDHNRKLLKDTIPRYADEAVNEFRQLWSKLSNTIEYKKNTNQLNISEEMENSTWFSEFIRSPDEAMSWAMTNPKLQAWLKTIDEDGNTISDPTRTSAWSRFVDFIRKLIGLKPDFSRTALDDVLAAGNTLLDRAQLDKPDRTFINKIEEFQENLPNLEMRKDELGIDDTKPLPFTKDDVYDYNVLRGQLKHGNLNEETQQLYRERLAMSYDDIPSDLIDNAYQAMREGREPPFAKKIAVYDNRTNKIVREFPNRIEALRWINERPYDSQHFGIERLGKDNRYMKRSQLAAEEDYIAHDLERAYKALDTGYTPTKRTWAEDRRDALELGFSPSQIRDLKERNPGELSVRLRRLHAAANMADIKLQDLEAKLDTDAWTMKDQAEYLKTLADFNYMTVRIKGEKAEIARALNAAKTARSYTNKSMAEVAELLEAQGSGLSRLADDPTEFNKFARSIKALRASGNPKGVHSKMLAVSKPYAEQYLTSFHYNAMLSGIGTHVKAPLDMMIGIRDNIIDHVLAWPIGKLANLVESLTGQTVKPGVTHNELIGRLSGILQAVFDHEVYVRTLQAAKTGQGGAVLPNGRFIPKDASLSYAGVRNPRIGVLSKPTDLIIAEDTYFRSVAMAQHLYGLGTREAEMQLKASGVPYTGDDVRTLGAALARAPTPTMLKEADEATEKALLLNANSLTNWIDKVKSVRPNATVGERVTSWLANNLAPFIRVAANSLITRTLERSPAAFLSPSVLKTIAKGGPDAHTALARIAYGTVLLGIYWSGYETVTGSGPDNQAKRKELEAGGWRANAVYKDGKYETGGTLAASLNPFDKHNTTAQAVADLRRAYEKGANQGQVATGLKLALGSIINYMTSQTWVDSVKPGVEAATADGSTANKVNQFFGSQAKSWVPNLVNQVGRMTNPNQMDARAETDGIDPTNITGSILNNMQAAIPGLNENLPIKYSVYGNPLPTGQTITGARTGIPGLDGNGIEETADLAEQELNRLTTSGLRIELDNGNVIDLNKSALITPVQKTINPSEDELAAIYDSGRTDLRIEDGLLKLTTKQFQDYQQLAGRAIVETVKEEMSTPEWQEMSDEEKVLTIREIQTDMKKAAREALFYGEQ